MKRTIERITSAAMLAVAFMLCATSAWADTITAVNPVTGDTDTYSYRYVGSSGAWTAGDWQNSESSSPAYAPNTSGSGVWDALLIDGTDLTTKVINAGTIEGWTLKLGIFNGASVTISSLTKWQGGCFAKVDGTSSLTISALGSGTFANAVDFYVAAENGITYSCEYNKLGATVNYYLAGQGSVSYQGLTAGTHVIKQADITLTGVSQVTNKTLVSFTSSTPTFTADATIKRLNSSGTDLDNDAHVATVTTGSTTLTTDNDVGTCELVQTSTGIVLYYVDGDPANLPAATVYKPSININFTNAAGNGLTTSADVGLDGYAVPGTSWNNFVVANNATFNTVNAIDSTGAASVASGVSVSISGTRGHWNCSNLTPASNPLHGYIDESAGGPTPTVTITGIPYDHYRVIVYHSTDQENAQFGYDTINGFNFTYVDGVQTEGTTSWGSAGASNSAEAIGEGTNTLVSAVLSGDTVTMVAHRIGGDTPTARGCFAAIQVVEYVPEVGENDLEIAVDGDASYSVDTAKTLSGTVYLTGSGTLTLSGSEKITAATIDVGKDVILNINADRLDATTFTGAGTVVYDGALPVTGKGWTAIGWSGTVWLKNKSGITGNSNATTGVQPNSLGNTSSKVKFSGVNGWIEAPVTYDPEIVLENAGYDYALQLINGNSPNATYTNRATTIKKLSGSGTLCCGGTSTAVPTLKVYDASGFTGSINTVNSNGDGYTGLVVVFCDEGASLPDTLVSMFIDSGLKRSIYVASGKEVTLATGATWTAKTGFMVDGTLNANGTLASSHATKAVSGSGTVVFTGSVPTNTGDAWWKNAAWTGTVWLKNASIAALDSNLYGNSESTLKFTNVTGYFAQNHVNTVPIELDGDGFYYNNGWGGELQTFSELKGSGLFKTGAAGNGGTIWVKKYSSFSGAMTLQFKKVVLGGSEPTHPNTNWGGQLVIADDSQIATIASGKTWGISSSATIDGTLAVNGFIRASGGIAVNGTLKAADRDKWGEDTAMTLGDSGVLELTSTANKQDYADYSGVTGTGTIKYSSTAGWRLFPSDDAKMPATTLTIQTELADSLIITKNNSGETVIGNLAGSKNIRSDWNAVVNAGDGRTLTVTQSKDTEWQGKFVNNRITQFNVVAPAEGDAGTLTLSGTQTVEIPATIGGKVNLTGTWVGATTVAGTIGGTGTLTGALTFSDGATFKANTNALTVSGTVTFPTGEGESVSVDVSGVTIPADGLTIMTATSINDIGKLSTTSANYFLVLDGATLKVYPVAALVYTENDATTIVAYSTIADAVSAAYMREYASKSYDYIVVNQSGATSAYASTVKIKSRNGVTVTLNPGSEEFGAYSQGEADENGVVTYSSTTSPTTYTWNGSSGLWELIGAWRYTDSNSTIQYATRHPMAGDTVVFTNSATVTLGIAAECATMTVGGSVGFTGADKTLAVSGNISGANAVTLNGVTMTIGGTVTDTTVVLASEGSSVTAGTSSGLSEPTTTVENAVVQVTNPSEGTVCYTAVMGVAVVDGTPYLTLSEAIAAAEAAGIALSDIELLDVEATPPAGYYIDNNVVCMYQAAIVNDAGTTTNYYQTAQLAIDLATYSNYGHFEIYYGTGVEVEVDLSQTWAKVKPIKFKCLNGSTVSVSIDSVEYELTPGDPVDGIVTYTKTPMAATYTWTGGAGAGNEQWGRTANWSVGGSTATRPPESIDSVIIGGGSTVKIVDQTRVLSLTISGAVVIDGPYRLTSNSAIALPAGASITLFNSAAISPVPTAADPVNYRVRTTATGYTVVEKVGTIFSVY